VHPILFEHLELLKLKGTSTAGKMMLFCVFIAENVSPFLIVSFKMTLFSDYLA